MDYNFLAGTSLFRGTDHDEIESVLKCLNAKCSKYPKGSMIFRAGDIVHEFGLVMSGAVSIENDDLWGNKTILDHIGPGQIFAESYACVPCEPMLVNVTASEDSVILMLDIGKILHICSNACEHHNKLISNLLTISSQKNLNLARHSFHTAPKSIRARLLSYLSYQVKLQGKYDLYIPFNRQQLADYLNVDRSALSKELSKMHSDGYLSVDKNHFILSEKITDET
ncbi:MAG: Crp/Fnr family transcriptional regulator [Oscillospiraceae bacterium]|nr:Crp/Fnr family transcriptional regulator [Oscillospiraceae bacterium]